MSENEKLRPDVGELDAELNRIRVRKKNRKKAWVLAIVFVVALMAGGYLATSYLAIYRITGTSMETTLDAGAIVVCQKGAAVKRGSIVAFERDDTLLIKRVIAIAGDLVSIDEDGQVTINGVTISEPYLADADTRQGDVTFPVSVPSGQVFVLGDNRVASIDSRDSSVGMVSVDEIIGCAKATIWPLSDVGLVKTGANVTSQ